jgi:hypothetical protein
MNPIQFFVLQPRENLPAPSTVTAAAQSSTPLSNLHLIVPPVIHHRESGAWIAPVPKIRGVRAARRRDRLTAPHRAGALCPAEVRGQRSTCCRKPLLVALPLRELSP